MSLQNRIALNVKWSKNSWTDKDQWPPVWPSQAHIDEYKTWCKSNIGTNGWNYYGYYRKIPCEFRFKRSEDLLAFKLTFGFHHDKIHV
jgi:hypothetical protein